MTKRSGNRSDAWAFCSLTPAQRLERLRLVRATIAPRVLREAELEDGFAWECSDDRETRARLEELISLERSCCGGLQWTLRQQPGRSVLRLEVRGRHLDAAQRDQFRRLGRGGAEQCRGDAGRAVLAAALSGAVFLCCILPLLAAAVGGAALGKILAPLDRPLVVVATAVAVAVFLRWVKAWQGRRRSLRQPQSRAC